eukprot:401279-Rhodomonas_salina.2
MRLSGERSGRRGEPSATDSSSITRLRIESKNPIRCLSSPSPPPPLGCLPSPLSSLLSRASPPLRSARHRRSPSGFDTCVTSVERIKCVSGLSRDAIP